MTEGWSADQFQQRTDVIHSIADGLDRYSEAVASGKYTNIGDLKRDLERTDHREGPAGLDHFGVFGRVDQ